MLGVRTPDLRRAWRRPAEAIGWALREYAWHDPREIERYVAENDERLSGLSRREATKNLSKLLA